ncbi:MAG TPA: hypothetical protein VFC42_03700 [Methylomirabilota bacterium]|nr:hypothetical protein [Methylomirabilota bacterium]
MRALPDAHEDRGDPRRSCLRIGSSEIEAEVYRQVARGQNVPPTHGTGRHVHGLLS